MTAKPYYVPIIRDVHITQTCYYTYVYVYVYNIIHTLALVARSVPNEPPAESPPKTTDCVAMHIFPRDYTVYHAYVPLYGTQPRGGLQTTRVRHVLRASAARGEEEPGGGRGTRDGTRRDRGGGKVLARARPGPRVS